MESSQLTAIIEEQEKQFKNKETGVPRNLDIQRQIQLKQISFITGMRRSGKSTWMRQIAEHYDSWYFMNFDDERLSGFELEDFQKMMIAFRARQQASVIFFDEIQYVAGWERFIRRIFDEGFKIFITGSNSKILSSDLATRLTGRYIRTEMYPFSFVEYLSFHKISDKDFTTDGIARILSVFDDYLLGGGFPEYLRIRDQEVLQRLYKDVLYKDLIAHSGIRNSSGFKRLCLFLATNFTKVISYNSLAKTLQLQSPNTVKEYISLLQDSYLFSELLKFDFSLKRQYLSLKKIYMVDNGLRNAVSFKSSEDKGRLLENLVFLELKRRNLAVFYYKTKTNKEVDFIIQDNPVQLIQVSYDISDPFTLQRELKALTEAMKELSLEQSTLLTYNSGPKQYKINGYTINIMPVWRWVTNSN
ncbi:MAG: ATP-binding protein [Bacteroidetes bacterium]|nr:ATP-binding protein [Bacteroidota bacterium]